MVSDASRGKRYDAQLRANPPVVIWKLVPDSGGLRIAIYVSDPDTARPMPRRLPPCSCDLYGSPRRRQGSHHHETCPRWLP